MKNKSSCYNLSYWNRELERVLLYMHCSGLIENEQESVTETNYDIELCNRNLINIIQKIIELKNVQKYKRRSEKHFIFREEENFLNWTAVPIQRCRHYIKTEEVDCDCKIAPINFHGNFSFFKKKTFSMVKMEYIARYPGQDVIFENRFHLNCENGYVSPFEEGVFTQVNLFLDDDVFYGNMMYVSFMQSLRIAGESSTIRQDARNFISRIWNGFEVQFSFVSERWIDPFSFTEKEFCRYLSWRRRKISLDEESSIIFIEKEILLKNQKKALQVSDKIYKAVPLEKFSEFMVMLQYLLHWAKPLIVEDRDKEKEKLSIVKMEHIARYPSQDVIIKDDFHLNCQDGYVSPLEKGVITQVNLLLNDRMFYENMMYVSFMFSLYTAGKSPTILRQARNFSCRTPHGFEVQFYFLSHRWMDPFSIPEKKFYPSFWRHQQIFLNEESSKIFIEQEILFKNRKKALQLADKIYKAVPLEKIYEFANMLQYLSRWAKPLIDEDREREKQKQKLLTGSCLVQ